MIGYCPQSDALNDMLTARESLRLMAILKGIEPSNTEKHVNKWIKRLGAFLVFYLFIPSGVFKGKAQGA